MALASPRAGCIDWVMKGPESEHAFDVTAARARLRLPDADAAAAHAYFRLAQHLKRTRRDDKVGRHFATLACQRVIVVWPLRSSLILRIARKAVREQ